jgi:hypothetical protein
MTNFISTDQIRTLCEEEIVIKDVNCTNHSEYQARFRIHAKKVMDVGQIDVVCLKDDVK